MKVPFTLTENHLLKVKRYKSKGLSNNQIAKLVGIPVEAVPKAEELIFEAIRKKRWTREQTGDLAIQYTRGLTLKEISTLLDKPVPSIVRRLTHIRDNYFQRGNRYDYLPDDLVERLLERLDRTGDTLKKNIKVGAIAPKKTLTKAEEDEKIKELINKLSPRDNVLLDEWWQFGTLKRFDEDNLTLTVISEDNNRVTLIKKYTPNWKEVQLKVTGLIGKFVSVRVVQNYLPVVNAGAGVKNDIVYEPRMIDLTASEGIMSLAKSFPSDTRNQSFFGRYKWLRFGTFEAKSTSEHILIGNTDGRVMAFRKGSINHVLENRLMNTLDAAEGQSILVCVDQKNPKPDGVLNAFVDVHIEEEGIETYNEDYNTIVETIARTTDDIEKITAEFQKTVEEAERQVEEKRALNQQKIEMMIREAEIETEGMKKLFSAQVEKLASYKNEAQRELKDYHQQERFLRDTKEGLQQYKVDVLAEAADRTGSGSTFQMKGLKIIDGEAAQWRDFNEALKAFEGGQGEEAQELYKEIQKLKKEVLKAYKNKTATSNASEDDEWDDETLQQFVDDAIKDIGEDAEPEGAEPDAPEADLSLFDEKKPDADSPIMAMMQEMMAEMRSLKSSQQSFLEASTMTDWEVQELRDYARAEEEELGEDNAKTEAEHKDIMDNVQEFVGKPPRQLKVYIGHARNTLCLRAGIDLTKEKPDNRIDVQFTKHIGKSTFRVHFPKYNHDALLTIVRDSKDRNDFAVKTCLHLDGERWKEAEEEVTGLGGKRLVGKKPKQWLAYRERILAKLEAPEAKKKARG